MKWSRPLLAAVLALALSASAGASAAVAAEQPTPIVSSGIVSFPSIRNVVVVGNPTGFTIDFDFTQPVNGWGPVYLGIYDGISATYPFDKSTFEAHDLGSNVGSGSIVPYPDKTGHVSQTFAHSRAKPVTVMLLSNKSICDCSAGHDFVAGATLAKLSPATAALTATAVPKITGTVKVGSTLTAVPGAWGPAPVALAYQWSVGGVGVAGATSKTFLLPSSSAGKTVTVTVTGSKTGYTTVKKTSIATPAVARLVLASTAVPKITGIVKVGSTLTATPGVWGPVPVTLTYQWSVGGVAVAGATLPTFVLPGSSTGKFVTVTVTGSKTGYTTIKKTSLATTTVKARL